MLVNLQSASLTKFEATMSGVDLLTTLRDSEVVRRTEYSEQVQSVRRFTTHFYL